MSRQGWLRIRLLAIVLRAMPAKRKSVGSGDSAAKTAKLGVKADPGKLQKWKHVGQLTEWLLGVKFVCYVLPLRCFLPKSVLLPPEFHSLLACPRAVNRKAPEDGHALRRSFRVSLGEIPRPGHSSTVCAYFKSYCSKFIENMKHEF